MCATYMTMAIKSYTSSVSFFLSFSNLNDLTPKQTATDDHTVILGCVPTGASLDGLNKKSFHTG